MKQIHLYAVCLTFALNFFSSTEHSVLLHALASMLVRCICQTDFLLLHKATQTIHMTPITN
ncbi:MAG: hypothetical protein EBT95_00605 [Verrucomicrobia bacterium]|nr:hypothetical protein [Verrucomicrobiota bacterium]